MSIKFLHATDHELYGQLCPVCKKELDRAATINPENPEGPKAGDLTICHGCGAVLFFGHDLQLVVPTESEWKEIEADQETYSLVRDLQQAVRQGRVVFLKPGETET